MRKLYACLIGLLASIGSMAPVQAQNPVPETKQDTVNDLPMARGLLVQAAVLCDSEKFEEAATSARSALAYFQTIPVGDDYAEATYLIGRALSRQDSLDKALLMLEEAIRASASLHPQGSAGEVKARAELGYVIFHQGDTVKALEEGNKALAMAKQLLPEKSAERMAAFRLMGNIYFDLGQNHEAIYYFEEAIKSGRLLYGNQSVKIARTMIRLGVSYHYSGFYSRGMTTLEEALSIQQKALSPTDPALAGTYLELGACQTSLKKYDNALFYLNQALDIYLKNYDRQYSLVAYCYSEIGQLFEAKRDYAKALDYFNKENDIMKSNQDTTGSAYAYTCNDFGSVYYALGNFPEAIRWQKKSLVLLRSAYKFDNQDIAAVLYYIGTGQSANGEYLEAIQSFEEDQRILKRMFGADCPILYHSDGAMGETYKKWYRKTGADSLLDNSRRYFRYAEKNLEQQLEKETSADTQQKTLVEAVPIFENAIATELLYGEKHNDPTVVQNAWEMSESMHSYLLFAATQEADARHFAGIPDALLAKDSLLRAETTMLEKQRHVLMEQGLSLTDTQVLTADAQIAAKKTAGNQLRSYFEQQYPDYFRLKFNLQTASLAQTQKLLEPQQTLLEYFTGDSAIYVFVLHANDQRVIELPRNFPLTDWVQELREGITGYHAAKLKPAGLYEKTVRLYADRAQKLYEKLLLPVSKFLTPELIIIPGEELANLPFEALLTGTPKDAGNFNTYPFLVRTRTIHYAYSATMLHQMTTKQHRKPAQKDLLALAPFFEENTDNLAQRSVSESAIRLGLSPLPYTGDEVKRVKTRFGSNAQMLTGRNATKQKFLELADQFQVLHLATHGKANHRDGDFSFLAFSTEDGNPENGLLSVGELYNCTLNADLVVLSACETGIGEEQRGEGVVSLARAFAFAGAKSIVSSLWSVSDKSTMQIMDNFYAELKSGKSKNLALADAKRQFLAQNPGLSSHPFFWAGFVAVGDMRVLKN